MKKRVKGMNKRIILALDFSDVELARDLLRQISPDLCRLKIGKQMFTLYGPEFVQECVSLGYDVFLDLKFHDIPNTVAAAVQAACDLGVWMLNVHVQGGGDMLRAARRVVDSLPGFKPQLIGVTVLTSLSTEDLRSLGHTARVEDLVLRYALLAQSEGLDGVVCSAQEARVLRQHVAADFKLVTPGIVLDSAVQHDQKRVLTPLEAKQSGADYLVIGRSIICSDDPVARLNECIRQLL
jgi:orotidine-5'-phosphate decarboxylase